MSCSICLSSFNTGCQVCTVCGTTLAEFKATTTLAANSQFVLADETLVSFQALSNLLGLTVEADTTFPNGTILQIIGNELAASSLLEGADSIVSTKDIEVPESSLKLGKSVSLHNQGGQLGVTGGGEEFYVSSFQVTASGSTRPTWYEFGAESLKAIQLVDTTTIASTSIQYLLSFGTPGDVWRFNSWRFRSNTIVSGVRLVVSLDAIPNAGQTNIIWKSHEDEVWNDGAGYTLAVGDNDLDTRGVTLEVDRTYYVTLQVPTGSGYTVSLLGDGSNIPFQQANAQTGLVGSSVTSDQLADFFDKTSDTSDDITEGSIQLFLSTAEQVLISGAEQSANKGAASGYAPLDASSKVPLANLPASVVGGVDFLGLWNASTNTPALSNGSGDNGDFYKVSVAGSTDFGAGSIAFNVGDQVIYNGTTTLWGRLGSDEDDTLQDVYSRGSEVDIDNTEGALKLSRGVGITNAAFNIVPSTVTPSANLADGDFHVEDGTIFLYDLARAKFLSSGTPVALQFGKNNGAGNEFIRFGGDARDGNSGPIFPWDATIVAITLKGSNNTGQSFDIEVDGVNVATLISSSSTISDDTLNLNVDAGETINLFAQAAGTEVDDPYAIIFVKRRKV